jgi:hypothetical protein
MKSGFLLEKAGQFAGCCRMKSGFLLEKAGQFAGCCRLNWGLFVKIMLCRLLIAESDLDLVVVTGLHFG